MAKPKISVIIPVYNVADYLDESLNSLLNQTFIDDIEVIMVDDGSTDESRYIIENYALDYDNFYAYHKENGGAGVARNYGLQFVKGEYIHFMDPDDYLDSHAYEKLYNLAVSNECDVVIGNAVKYDRYKIWDENLFKRSFKGIEEDLKIDSVTERLSILWDTVLWNKLFRADFVKSNNIRFPDANVIYQDIPFTLRAYVLANSIYITTEIMYYWRLRKKSTSSTQQYQNIKTFFDRIMILELSERIMNELDVDDEIRNYEYHKWLNHDLKLFLKRLTKFSEEYYDDIMSNIQRVLGLIPSEFIDDLNSYKRVMYKMVENDDLESLINFSNMENELMLNPVIPDYLDEKYHKFIDFKRDGLDEKFNVEKMDIEVGGKNIMIDFNYNINYVSNTYSHKLNAKLVEGENEYDLQIIGERLLIPIDLIKGLTERASIKIVYDSDDYNKETFLKSHKRQVIRFDDVDLEFGIGVNRVFTVNVRKTNDNIIMVEDITFEDGEFKFTGRSDTPIVNIVLENVITFDKKTYDIDYGTNSFRFIIPYSDICNNPIRKWEVKTDSLFNRIMLPKKISFYRNSNKILFLNARNKILIEEDIYNKYDELYTSNIRLNDSKKQNYDLKAENRSLIDENHNLNRENLRLKNKLEEYKSRKIVRFADKVKH